MLPGSSSAIPYLPLRRPLTFSGTRSFPSPSFLKCQIRGARKCERGRGLIELCIDLRTNKCTVSGSQIRHNRRRVDRQAHFSASLSLNVFVCAYAEREGKGLKIPVCAWRSASSLQIPRDGRGFELPTSHFNRNKLHRLHI